MRSLLHAGHRTMLRQHCYALQRFRLKRLKHVQKLQQPTSRCDSRFFPIHNIYVGDNP